MPPGQKAADVFLRETPGGRRSPVLPAEAVTVPLTATPGGGATAADYAGVPASLTFDRANTVRTFTVIAPADADDDDGESVAIGFGTCRRR